MWVERKLKDRLLQLVKSSPALLLTGARQVGKSSLLQREFPEVEYITFDYLRQVDAVKESPEYFLSQFKDQVILDEIQYVPEVFRNLKIFIDKERQNYGKWIMTGSQQFVLMEHVSESLAGRISLIHLETLSAAELRNEKIQNLKDFLWKGGYPELWSNKGLEMSDFFESYIRTYIERDLKAIIDVKNLSDFRRFIRMIAARTGQLLNYKSLSSDVGVSDVTIRKWTHALEIGGLIYLLTPYYANIGKRLIKSPKIYFADHGLLSYLLGIENEKDWYSHPQRGSLWENLVMMELIKNYHLIPGNDLFFYRDQNGVEIDFIIEKKGKMFFIEAKAGERIDSKKLHFDKVAPLFKDKFHIEKILALNINETKVIKKKNYSCYNPLYSYMLHHSDL
ncbi:MAG: AAA family ATPase [Deltaproteobacteria bacterium]|nr:MAG: AAA family ATPase [Deltaproteobacteria bacterium]